MLARFAEAQVIQGKKVVLRPKKRDDAVHDYAWRKDSELASLDAASPIVASLGEFLAEYYEELEFPSPRRQRFAIDTLDGRHIGNCTYYDINEARGEAELGIMIGDKAYWNQGFGADAINTLLAHIFSDTQLQRIYLSTLDWNKRAQECFRKCGFIPCGRLVQEGSTFLIMEIRREQWLIRQKKQEKAGS